MSHPPVKMICETCGSDDVRVDAWAEWGVEAQKWVLAETYEYSHCNVCEGECNIVEKAL